MSHLVLNHLTKEEMETNVHSNLSHFTTSFWAPLQGGVLFDRYQVERRQTNDRSGSVLTVTIQKSLRVDTAEIICSSVAEVSETGVVRYEVIEAKFKYNDGWLIGSRSMMINENEQADRFSDEQYHEWAKTFVCIYWSEWNHEAQTVLEHLKVGQQYYPIYREPICRPGLDELVVRTAKFSGVNLDFSPALKRIFVGLGKLFDEHGLNVSPREVKTDAEKGLILAIGLGVPELDFIIDVRVSWNLKGKGRPRKLANAIDSIPLHYYRGDDLSKAVAGIARDYELVMQKRIEQLEIKFSQWEKFKNAGFGA